MQTDTSPLLEKVAEFFSFKNYKAENNAVIEGRSGAKHKFDIVVTSEDGNKSKLAVLDGLSQDTISDVMMFNAIAEDCGIQLKVVAVDRELNDPEINLLNTYHMSVVNKRSKEIVNLRPVLFGITELDRMLNGAMRKGNVYLISGGVGVGKTILATHFLLQGARLKERGAIIITDSIKEQFLSNARRMFPDFDRLYKDGTIEVIEPSESLRDLKRYAIRNSRNIRRYVKRLSEEIKNAVAGSKIQRLVIDPITPMIIEDDELINQFFNSLNIPECITLITSGIRKSDLSIFGIEEYSVSGVIKLEADPAPSDGKRATIVKMRGGTFIPGPLFFRISENGITESERDKILHVLSYDKTIPTDAQHQSEGLLRKI